MINKNQEILLTVYLGGGLGTTVSHASSKENISKVRTSPFERLSDDGKTYIKPKKHFLAPNDYKPREERRAMRKTRISPEAVDYFLSGEVPSAMFRKADRAKWQKMSEQERLEWHMKSFDEGHGYEWKFLID